MALEPLYETRLGKAYCADSLDFMRSLRKGSVDLVLTSPPYALHFKKEYGNADQAEYVAWFLPFAEQIKRILKENGSFVLNVGGAWTPGAPQRSLYHYRLLLALCDELGFHLCQEFFWYNPAKMPAPAEWVNVRRIRVKDSVEYIFWLSATPHPKADNTQVLNEYSADMKRLIKRGVKKTVRPSGHNITGSFANDKGGSIPSNLIECGNNESNSFYIKEPNEKVLDPFAGSNTTGRVAETLGRRWIAIERDRQYAEDSQLRFISDVESLSANGQSLLF